MRILHMSDHHGDLAKLFSIKTNFDVCVMSGDMLPNMLHDGRNSGNPEDDAACQRMFLVKNRDRIKSFFGDRKVLYVPGNHDWIDLSLCGSNFINVDGKIVDYYNEYWYGRSDTPIMQQWNHYTAEKTVYVPAECSMFISHVPEKGILDLTDKKDHIGLEFFGAFECHFHGHIHEAKGFAMEWTEHRLHSNAAGSYNVIEW